MSSEASGKFVTAVILARAYSEGTCALLWLGLWVIRLVLNVQLLHFRFCRNRVSVGGSELGRVSNLQRSHSTNYRNVLSVIGVLRSATNVLTELSK